MDLDPIDPQSLIDFLEDLPQILDLPTTEVQALSREDGCSVVDEGYQSSLGTSDQLPDPGDSTPVDAVFADMAPVQLAPPVVFSDAAPNSDALTTALLPDSIEFTVDSSGLAADDLPVVYLVPVEDGSGVSCVPADDNNNTGSFFFTTLTLVRADAGQPASFAVETSPEPEKRQSPGTDGSSDSNDDEDAASCAATAADSSSPESSADDHDDSVKRRKNNEAARRYRQRKKLAREEHAKQLKELEKTRRRLTDRVKTLRAKLTGASEVARALFLMF